MALNTSKCNRVMTLGFKGLNTHTVTPFWIHPRSVLCIIFCCC